MIRRGRDPGFEHPWWIVVVASAAGLLAWLVASQRPVPAWELDAAAWFNGAPDSVATALVPIMQVGTLGAPLVLALVTLLVKRDLLLSVGIAGGGLAAWFGAKLIKDGVERGRPIAYLPETDVREPSAQGFGFISGHSAVSMFTAVIVLSLLPRRWRPVALAVAGAVGVARLVVGVHLPADVVGGWAFGALLAVGVVAAVTRIRVWSGRSAGRLGP